MAIVWLMILPFFFFNSSALATLLWLWALALKVTSATRCVWGSRRRCRRRTSSTCSSCSRHCPQSSRCCKGRRGRQRKASYSFWCSLLPDVLGVCWAQRGRAGSTLGWFMWQEKGIMDPLLSSSLAAASIWSVRAGWSSRIYYLIPVACLEWGKKPWNRWLWILFSRESPILIVSCRNHGCVHNDFFFSFCGVVLMDLMN